ncbi:hypothetical protein [Aquimarina sp. 2201CG5-10]|uniref:hypothetical protein n=1 Tax=Aquimarina callyspongiae TaxID=3098150 RepID=UPI002AB3A052|nr:hypothetical protein [Aquimarina sp. 2201CG5-10]MDY8137564.1 hypothetical protein [Aquimarina sp. 2201CG5-10]
MVGLKSEIYGIDKPISVINNELSKSLSSIGNIKIYDRCYKNLDNNEKIIPQVYVGGGEYKTPHLNDRDLITFILDSDNHSTVDSRLFKAKIKIVCISNLSVLTNNRNDSYLQQLFKNTVERCSKQFFKINEIQKGHRGIFAGYDYKQYKFLDTQPYHMFSVNGEIEYYLTKKCND